jgi:tetratricopeptide (TPR) repeat protein
MIRQELPHETYIEMAIQYYDWNMAEEALRMLALAPAHPMVQIWQAYILDRTGKKDEAANKLDMAMAASPELVFPFRPSMIKLFSWANEQKPNWKWRYYEALIYWQTNQTDIAKTLFNSCGTDPDFVPFYLAKAELFQDDPATAGESLDKAYQLDPFNWRTGLKLAKYYSKEKHNDKALLIAAKNYKAHPVSFIVGLQYANMLKLNGRYVETLSTLSHLEVLPAEGDVNAHSLFRETNALYALEFMKTHKWNKAISYLQKAETWPENLFSGEPYFADNRMTRFLTAYCYEKLKNQSKEGEVFTYITTYKNPDGWTSLLGNKLTDQTTAGSRNFKAITESLLKEKANDRDKDLLNVFLTIL